MYTDDRFSGFHESYYAHTCPIIPEEDVLLTDIEGRGCFAAIRRWWHDLFLLSASNESSRGFYNSSHAMRIERFRQYRKHRSRIHPMSKFTNFWNYMVLFTFFANKILFRFTSAIIIDNMPIYYYFAGVIFEFIIIMDLIVNLKSGYIDERIKKVVLDTEMSLVNYCSKKLFLHFISAIPVHWFMFLKYGWKVQCGLCKFNMFICVLKIVNVFGLYRVFELSSHMTNKRYSPTKSHVVKFLRIGIVGLVCMFEFYEMVDVVWVISMLVNQKMETTNFIGHLIWIRYGVYLNNLPNYLVLGFDISRIFKSLLLFSFNTRNSTGSLDKLSALIAFMIANGFYVWSIMECYSMVSSSVYPTDKLISARNSVLNLIGSRQLSDKLRYKVKAYFEFKHSKLSLLTRSNGLYRSLPPVLKRETTLYCYVKLILKIPVFAEWPFTIIEELALLLKQEIYLPNDVVMQAWTERPGLLIVDGGVLAVYTVYKVETGHLIDGDFFGETSLFTDREINTSYVIAVTSSRILFLDKIVFRSFMMKHPKLFDEIKENLESCLVDDEEEFDERPLTSEALTRKLSLQRSYPRNI